MKMGIPVAAYINEDDLHFIPEEFANEVPIINIRVDNIVEKLSAIVEDREQLIEYGNRARLFVEKWHDPKYVASLTKAVYSKRL